MFVVSVKPNRKKALLVAFLCVVVTVSSAALLWKGEEPAAARDVSASIQADTNEARIAYLKTFGWSVEEEPLEIVEVAIPLEFGEVYEEYNQIQKNQGFDLEAYQGQRVKRYTYTVTNYPNYIGGVRANLLVCEGQVIGGDLCSVELDGFLHGFSLPK